MELVYPTILTLPFALGLLGFVEPCTIGAHVLFLNTITDRPKVARFSAVAIFVLVRTLVMGAIGTAAAFLGQQVLSIQSALWLLFGALYVAIGITYATGHIGHFSRAFHAAPAAWRSARNPALLGTAFGFSIPACAAPIFVALLGLAAGSGTLLIGFTAMAVFALGLSVPLVVLAVIGVPSRLHVPKRIVRWLMAVVFIAVGAWSIWFGLFVDASGWTV